MRELPPVQVFGQPELEAHLKTGGAHHTHLVSIGNPRAWFVKNRPDSWMPKAFRQRFDAYLRLQFYDVEEKRHLRRRQFPKRIPTRRDVVRAIKFFERTKDEATGYTIHCWQGVSRSTAFALGYLYMLTGSERESADLLMTHRPQAGPHQKIVAWFDELLGSNLVAENERIRRERFERWKRELNLTEESLLEELPEATPESGNEPA